MTNSASATAEWDPKTAPPNTPARQHMPRPGVAAETTGFLPPEPKTLKETGLSSSLVESLVLKFLLSNGDSTGRQIADQIRLPFGVMQDELARLKAELLVAYKENARLGDYVYELRDHGVEKARRFVQHSTFFGSAPVTLPDYIRSVQAQSVRDSKPRMDDLRRALKDMLVTDQTLSRVGQAVNEGRGIFLYGDPGNGKTCMAERVVRAISPYLWIPRTIMVNGEIIRIYDPICHEEAPLDHGPSSLLDTNAHDERWIRIKRPTVVVGGELAMHHLDFHSNPNTGVMEAPIQLKSNGGALLIDDFGRQRMSTSELLNRWIIPLEKGYDNLALTSGRQIQVPFDQLIIFATNLDPKDLVDEAFLRRIPYKVKLTDPSEFEFRQLFLALAQHSGIECPSQMVDYLLIKHYKPFGRPMRFCHPRDLLRQVTNYCEFHELKPHVSSENLDEAVRNYFGDVESLPS